MRAVEGASPYKNAFGAIRTVGDAALGVPQAGTQKPIAPRRIRATPVRDNIYTQNKSTSGAFWASLVLLPR